MTSVKKKLKPFKWSIIIHHDILQCDTTSWQRIPKHAMILYIMIYHIIFLDLWLCDFWEVFVQSLTQFTNEIIHILEKYHDMSGCVWRHHVVSRCVIMCHGISLYISLMMQASLQPVKSSEGLRKGVRWRSGACLYQSHPIYEPKVEAMIYTRWSLEYTDYL